MSTTIEPRLIALLNEPSTIFDLGEEALDLPPLQDPNILKASGRRSALEPITSTQVRVGVQTPNGHLGSGKKARLLPDHNDSATVDSSSTPQRPSRLADRALGLTSPQSLHKILDDGADIEQNATSRKRQRLDADMADFVQLPQLPKKHPKTPRQIVPPMIIGLQNPPPNASRFPPITSSAFHDSHGRNSLNIGPPSQLNDEGLGGNLSATNDHLPSKQGHSPKKQVRKRWTEIETNHMLLGVHKYGVGKWKQILADPSYSFNGRRPVDLKDRFRTCCPAEYRNETSVNRTVGKHVFENGTESIQLPRPTSGLTIENILIPESDQAGSSGTFLSAEVGEPDLTSPKASSRSHRKNISDLADLGIDAPFKVVHRTSRRHFTAEEDRHILQGFDSYGPMWTKIRQDPNLHLISRRATDIRDRFRNRYPDKYGFPTPTLPSFQASSSSQAEIAQSMSSTTTLPYPGIKPNTPAQITGSRTVPQEYLPSNTAFSHKLPISNFNSQFPPHLDMQPSLHTSMQAGQAENMPDMLPFSNSIDWDASIIGSAGLGDMDIQRLLLDENWSTGNFGTYP